MIDIRMPFLNGLELIEKINGILSDCIIIVVSGHDEFEYAQRALQLKVFEYVLKPVPQDVLAGVLARAEEALRASRGQRKYVAWAREQLDRNMPLLREQFLRDWVHARLSPLEIAEQAAFLGMQISGAAVHGAGPRRGAGGSRRVTPGSATAGSRCTPCARRWKSRLPGFHRCGCSWTSTTMSSCWRPAGTPVGGWSAIPHRGARGSGDLRRDHRRARVGGQRAAGRLASATSS